MGPFFVASGLTFLFLWNFVFLCLRLQWQQRETQNEGDDEAWQVQINPNLRQSFINYAIVMVRSICEHKGKTIYKISEQSASLKPYAVRILTLGPPSVSDHFSALCETNFVLLKTIDGLALRHNASKKLIECCLFFLFSGARVTHCIDAHKISYLN